MMQFTALPDAHTLVRGINKASVMVKHSKYNRDTNRASDQPSPHFRPRLRVGAANLGAHSLQYHVPSGALRSPTHSRWNCVRVSQRRRPRTRMRTHPLVRALLVVARDHLPEARPLAEAVDAVVLAARAVLALLDVVLALGVLV
jgi:hypothetical protein